MTVTLTRRVRAAADVAFVVLFVLYAAFALAWLASGVGAAFRHPSPWSGGARFVDYVFSGLNLALGGFLVWRRPRDTTARLMAVGMVGTAAGFNLQSHATLDVPGSLVQALHIWLHHILAGVAYVFALILFGRKRTDRLSGKATLLWLPAAALLTFVAYRTWSLGTVGFILLFGLLIPLAGIVWHGLRARRSEGVERREAQFLVLALSPAFITGLVLVVTMLAIGYPSPVPTALKGVLFRILAPPFAAIPVAMFVGILRYGLWDIEVVVSRALLYTGLAGFVTGGYVAIVAAVGAAAGARGSSGIWVSLLASLVVAIAFQPFRDRLRRVADRLVYGERAAPYEVLAGFAGTLAQAQSVDEVLPGMAASIAGALGAEACRVSVRLEDPSAAAGTWPPEATGSADFDCSVPVFHQGERVGAIEVRTPDRRSLSTSEDRLLADLAAQGGVALRNVLLTGELRARLRQISAQAVEVAASRRRLLGARDDERRRVEARISADVERRLDVVASELARADEIIGFAPSGASALLESASAATSEALEVLRAIARDTFPQLLAEAGLVPALRAECRKSGAGVRLVASPHAEMRFDRSAEAAVYFSCVRALRRAGGHSTDTEAVVELECDEDWVRFSVALPPEATILEADLQEMRDRLAAVGGTLDDRSPGRDVAGRAPVRPGAPPPTTRAGRSIQTQTSE